MRLSIVDGCCNRRHAVVTDDSVSDGGCCILRVERCWLRSANCQMAVVAVANDCCVAVPSVNRLLLTECSVGCSLVVDAS